MEINNMKRILILPLAIIFSLCAIQPTQVVAMNSNNDALNRQFLSTVKQFLNHAQKKDLIKAEQLLSQGAEINTPNNNGETSLIRATKYKNEPMCKFLLEHGANVNAQTTHGQTALMAASSTGNAAICTLLIAHKADVNLKNTKGSTALLLASVQEKNKAVCKILLDAGAEVDAHGEAQNTPLLAAARGSKDNEVCKILIEHDADINAQCMQYRASLLQYYVNDYKNDDAQMFKFLINCGANPYLKDNYDDTALYDLAVSRRIDMQSHCEYLITHSHITPFCTKSQLKSSQQRTRARLSALKSTPIPKVLYELILSIHPDVWKDACNTPLLLHSGKYSHVHLLPLGIACCLINNNALTFDKTVSALTAHKIEKLKPHLQETAQTISERFPEVNLPNIFNPNLLEQNYGIQIVTAITEQLTTAGARRPSPENGGTTTKTTIDNEN
jgi:ankyrin repeat protein